MLECVKSRSGTQTPTPGTSKISPVRAATQPAMTMRSGAMPYHWK